MAAEAAFVFGIACGAVGPSREGVAVDRAVPCSVLQEWRRKRRFYLASPAERPIHLGAIQRETLNLSRLFFEQVICVCE